MGDVSAGDGWAAVAAAMKTRMAELGLTQFDVAARSGVSLATVREMLSARDRQRSPRTLSAVSKALGWPTDRLAAIVQGRAAPPRSRPAAGEPDVRAELKSIREELQRISRRLDDLEAGSAEDGK